MNFYIFWLFIVFFIAENNYYGWNRLPKSSDELICKGICAILLAMAFLKEKRK